MANNAEFSLWVWGANSHGQLGIGSQTEMEVSPVEVDLSFLEAQPVQIAGGGGHTLILDKCGQVYSCGWNNKGQLGVGTMVDRTTFIKLPQDVFGNKKIKSIACGWDSSGAVAADGSLFLWGANYFQQVHSICSSILSPHQTIISPQEIITNVAFGLRHVCLLTQKGEMLFNGKAKFLNKDATGFQSVTKELATKIVTGQHHCIFLDKTGEVHCRGDNKFNQLSDDSLKNFTSQVVDLKCGWTHSGLLTNSRRVFLWGRNTYGQIGKEPEKSILTPTQLDVKEEIQEFHLGSEHGLCVTKSGDVFTWGWNEHGNCGNETTEDVYKPQKVKLPGKCLLAGVGAGFCCCLVNC